MLKQLLVAYDGSSDSDQALKKAIYLAKKTESELEIVFVEDEKKFAASVQVEQTNSIPPAAPVLDSTMYPKTQHLPINVEGKAETAPGEDTFKEEEVIFSEANIILASENMKAKTEVLVGQPDKEICDYAQNHNKDMIIIGHRGLSLVKKLVMGSTSEKVVKNANCPVLVVK
ncbi:universal stress protein [Litchfieldia salsa]|uniref:Nucleotide-binding universal stress protein, UspA family n=1 Tax=Litchfieldia salsa TaxID=930152 RepID=A0A1H0UYW9_9BACI|nr:universal stress protein [Litchfieldia salsa]SDP71367.1 Nucleotide-binding universal stress protein, UspA family [Litchfieldia salsa]